MSFFEVVCTDIRESTGGCAADSEHLVVRTRVHNLTFCIEVVCTERLRLLR